MDRELIEKAKKAENVEELLSLAEENKIKLSKEESEKIFARLHNNGELTEDDLDKVSGGGCSEYVYSGHKYAIGEYVSLRKSCRYRYSNCDDCIRNCWIVKEIGYGGDGSLVNYGVRYYTLECAKFGYTITNILEEDIKGYCTNI